MGVFDDTVYVTFIRSSSKFGWSMNEASAPVFDKHFSRLLWNMIVTFAGFVYMGTSDFFGD